MDLNIHYPKEGICTSGVLIVLLSSVVAVVTCSGG